MDLYRAILREVESWSTTLEPKEVELREYTRDQINHHAYLLAQEGLLEGLDVTGDGDSVHRYSPTCLTPEGHDFLEAAQNDTAWQRANDMLREQRGPLTTKFLGFVLQKIHEANLLQLLG